MALQDMDLHFAWQVWHLWHWAASGVALGSDLTPLSPRLLLWQAWHLAGVALRDMDIHFAWQAWHFWHWAASGGALGSRLWRGKLALVDIPVDFVWQAWDLWHGAASGCVCNESVHVEGRGHAFANAVFGSSATSSAAHANASPIPSSPLFGDLLEEVDVWCYPVL